VALVVAVLALSVLPAGAQGPSNDPAAAERAEREKAKARSGELDEEIDALTASDVELKAELARLDARVAELEAAAAEATAEQERIEGELADMRQRVADAEEAVEIARDLAAERAVAAYMQPERESATQMLAAEDPQTLGRMNTLIRHVALHDRSVMVNRQMAEAELQATRAELEAAQVHIDELRAQAESDLAEAQGMRARQDEVQVQLEARIDQLVTESNALEAQEANLTALIVQRETAATSTTTTTAAPTTTTTTAPPTTIAAAASPAPTVAPTTTKPPATTTPPTTRPSGGGGLSWPVNGPVTSPYGPRWGTFHRGIDIGVGMGTPIAAASGGTVFFAGEMSGYGLVVLIDHGNGMVTLYAHQSQLMSVKGQSVARGTTIGLVGSTGHSTGPHLHFEVRLGSNGNAVDPMGYLG
jgi:septal ring factor EnvC (AmiA/AmiB activator)